MFYFLFLCFAADDGRLTVWFLRRSADSGRFCLCRGLWTFLIRHSSFVIVLIFLHLPSNPVDIKKGLVYRFNPKGGSMSLDIIKLLRKTSIFSNLDSASLKKISSYFKERSHSAGEILFKEGTLGDKLYIIKEGAIRISKEAKEGEEETSQVLRREGEVFGEAGFLDEVPRPVTASADKSTKVLHLSRSNFLTILNQHPLIAYQIVKILSARLKQSDLRVIDELKERNDLLQKAYQCLLEMIKDTKGTKYSDSKPNPTAELSSSTGEKESFPENLFSHLPFAVICTDQNDSVTFFNEYAEEEFGYKGEDMTGKSVNLLWKDNSWRDISPDIQQNIRENNFWEGEIIAQKQNGENFLSLLTISGMVDTCEQNSGRLYLCRNVTKKRSEDREEWIKEILSERQHIATEIASLFGKEIKALAEAYETHPYELDEANLNKSMTTLAAMRNALDNIQGIISGLTFVSSLYTQKEPLDLAKLFEEELLLLKFQDKFRDITFTTHFEEGMPQVHGDKRQLKKLLYSLLDNSAFSLQSISHRKKAITIEVGSINKKQELQIQILDNGIGICPANLPQVFKEHFTTRTDGLGLGLLSVGRTVENHGGTIEVESDEGTYTLFVIKLPAYQEKPAITPEVESPSKILG
jgi:PAS domain S-box-containing protein